MSEPPQATAKDRFGRNLQKGDLVHIIDGNQIDLGQVYGIGPALIEIEIIRRPGSKNHAFPRSNQLAFVSDEYRDMSTDYIAGLYGIKTKPERPMLAFDPGNQQSRVFNNNQWVNQKTTWQGAKVIGSGT